MAAIFVCSADDHSGASPLHRKADTLLHAAAAPEFVVTMMAMLLSTPSTGEVPSEGDGFAFGGSQQGEEKR